MPSHRLRSKFSSGRSSIGLAGPSGVAPLFKAVGTAAASVGMQLSEYVNFQGLLQSHKQATVSVSSPQESALSENGDINKSKSKFLSVTTFYGSDKPIIIHGRLSERS